MAETRSRVKTFVGRLLTPQLWQGAFLSIAILVASALLGLLLGIVAYRLSPSTYTSSTQLLLVPRAGTSVADVNYGANMATTLAPTYAQAIRATSVIQTAALRADISDASVASSLTTDVPLNTGLINIHVTRGSPDEAVHVADIVTQTFLEEIVDIAPKTQAGTPVLQPIRLQSAVLAAAPNKNPRLFQAVGGFSGLAAGAMIVVIRRALDSRSRSASKSEPPEA